MKTGVNFSCYDLLYLKCEKQYADDLLESWVHCTMTQLLVQEYTQTADRDTPGRKQKSGVIFDK